MFDILPRGANLNLIFDELRMMPIREATTTVPSVGGTEGPRNCVKMCCKPRSC